MRRFVAIADRPRTLLTRGDRRRAAPAKRVTEKQPIVIWTREGTQSMSTRRREVRLLLAEHQALLMANCLAQSRALMLGRSTEEAEDLVQEAFLRVYRGRKKYHPRAKFSTWLYTIAKNQAIDAMRRTGRHPTVSLDQSTETEDGDIQSLLSLVENRQQGPSDAALGEEPKQLIRASVDRLPDFLRQVVLLAYYQGLKYREIADVLGIPVGTVRLMLATKVDTRSASR